jgi:hypothetical protein
VTVFLSPGARSRPADALNSLGAPEAAVNCPFVPVTKWCVPPDESSKVTDSPALIVTFVVPLKLLAPRLIVALPLPALVLQAAGGKQGQQHSKPNSD